MNNNTPFAALAQAALDAKTKPPGALGRLEALAHHIACLQNTLHPTIDAPQVVVFAADHGIAAQGVSAYPAVVTAQMVHNFVSGGAAVCVLARAHDATLHIVDAGVNADLSALSLVRHHKIAWGTNDFSLTAAMSAEAVYLALATGAKIVQTLPGNTFIPGEMGIGNTSSAAALMAAITDLPLSACIGRGTGIDDARFAHKQQLLGQALRRWTGGDIYRALQQYGGLEIAMMTGALIEAARERRFIIVDGFVVSVAVLLASRVAPEVLSCCVFAHGSAEAGHGPLLQWLGVSPLLQWQMRLGEASGAVLVLPLLRAACHIMNNMATFSTAGVASAC